MTDLLHVVCAVDYTYSEWLDTLPSTFSSMMCHVQHDTNTANVLNNFSTADVLLVSRSQAQFEVWGHTRSYVRVRAALSRARGVSHVAPCASEQPNILGPLKKEANNYTLSH